MSLLTRKRLVEDYLDSLILYYPLYEGEGTIAKDLSPFSRDGTISDSPGWATGPLGNALQFDQNAQIATPSFAFTSATSCLTFVGWVNCDYSINSQFMFYAQKLTILRQHSSDVLLINCKKTGSTITGYGDANFFTGYDNAWVHFAIVLDFPNGNADFYRDGIWRVQAHEPLHWEFPNIDEAKTFGYGVQSWIGYMDELRIFDRALTPAEVFEEYYLAARFSY